MVLVFTTKGYDMGCNTRIAHKCSEKLFSEFKAPTRQEWLDKSVGIVTAMLPHIGYENSAMIAKEAYNTGKPVREVILEKGLISKEKMEKILSPKQMTTPGIAG